MAGWMATRRMVLFGLIAVVAGFGLIASTPVARAQDDQSLTVQVAAEDDSGVTGTAVLTADGDQTILDLELVGGEAGYEGHIFDSTCDNHQAATVFYAIEPVDDSLTSQSTLDVSFDEITNGTYWIHVHKPGGERGIGVACGQILSGDAVGGELPAAGVGFGSNGNENTMLLLAVIAAAGLFAIGMRLRDQQMSR